MFGKEKGTLMSQLLARLKPFAPGKGHLLKTYSIHGYIFRVERGWYEVDESIARYLSTVRNGDSSDAQLAFDVMTTEEAQALDQREKRSQQERAEAISPIRSQKVGRTAAAAAAHAAAVGALTTADLPGNQRADTTDALEGEESDLDKDDLAPVAVDVPIPQPAKVRPSISPPPPGAPIPPGAPKSWGPPTGAPRSARSRAPGT